MACRNLCERLYSKIIFGKSHYEGGKKYCRRCEVYFLHNGSFCPCYGMTLRTSPTNKRDKERMRRLKFRGDGQDGIIRIIKEQRSTSITIVGIATNSLSELSPTGP